MSIPLDKPNIVIPVTDAATLREITNPRAVQPWDIVEIRVDRIPEIHELYSEISSIPAPVLLTCRHPDEGGFNELHDPQKRHTILAPMIPHAAAIDIEIASAAQMTQTISLAKTSGLTLILSAHDFSGTPENKQLCSMVKNGIENGADTIKIATTTESPDALCRLFSLFKEFPHQPLALMGMGQLGMASRLIAAQSGSILNYAALEEANAPGQWPVQEFRNLLQRTGIVD